MCVLSRITLTFTWKTECVRISLNCKLSTQSHKSDVLVADFILSLFKTHKHILSANILSHLHILFFGLSTSDNITRQRHFRNVYSAQWVLFVVRYGQRVSYFVITFKRLTLWWPGILEGAWIHTWRLYALSITVCCRVALAVKTNPPVGQ